MYNPKKKINIFERQVPGLPQNRQEKTKENFNTIVPINNDSSTIFQTGSISSRGVKVDRKKDGNAVSLSDRMKVLSVEPDSVKATTIVRLLTQGLHNHDAA